MCTDVERSPGYIVNLKPHYRTVTTICYLLCKDTYLYLLVFAWRNTVRMKVIKIITIDGMVNVGIVFLKVCFFF